MPAHRSPRWIARAASLLASTLFAHPLFATDCGERASSGAGRAPTEAWIESVARRIAPDATLQTGAGTDALVSELQRVTCGSLAARQWFSRTCAALSGPTLLVELRTRFVRDALELPSKVHADSSSSTPEQRLLIAVLATAAEGGSTRGVLRQLMQTGEPSARSVDLCAPKEILLQRLAALTDPLARAALLVTLFDDETRSSTPSAQDVEVILSGLVERASNAPNGSVRVNEAQRAAIATLSRDWPRVSAVFDAADSSLTEQQLIDAFSRLVTSVQAALELVGTPNVAPKNGRFEYVADSLRALASGDITSSVRPLLVTDATRRDVEVAFELLERIQRFLRAPNSDARYRVLRSTVLGLGSWADHVQADARIGAMAVDVGSADYRLAADLGLGYHDLSWGIEASGSSRAFQTTTGTTFEDLDRYEGALEVWYATHPEAPLRFDGRLRLGAFIYDSNRFLQAAQYDETSAFGRGALLAGLRYETLSWSGGVWLGGGLQHEIYDSLTFATLVSDRRQTTRSHLQGRVQGAWAVWPSVLALRAELDSSLFSITRVQTVEALGNGVSADSQTRFRELDTAGTLSLDVDAFGVAGFVPGASLAFEHSRRAANGQVEEAFAPAVQIGVHRLRY